MVDVDRRLLSPALAPAHSAALRRLSARAATTSSAVPSARNGLFTFSSLAHSVISRLRNNSVPVDPGLTEPELARIESRLNFTFPPDLRAVLSLGLPSAPGFPDWRNPNSALDLPIVSLSLQLARNPTFWPRSSWGPRPSDPDAAISAARSNLRRAPPLVPVFRHCYLPSRPCLAGNPVFFVDDSRVFVCSSDLLDFFTRHFNSGGGGGGGSSVRTIPRWIEFWSDAAASAAAADRRRRSSSSSSERRSSSSSASSSAALSDANPDPERYVEIRPPRVPVWVSGYLDRIGSVLRTGGWGETEVREMVHASSSRSSDEEEAVMDDRAVLDVLTVKADGCSDWLKRAGWSSEEVTGLGLGLGRIFREDEKKRSPVNFPPEIRFKVEKLAQEICKC